MTAEDLLALHLDEMGVEYEREYHFAKPRRFRFDFIVLPKRLKLAIEIEGGVWTGGRHVRGVGFERDIEKYNLAVVRGWRVLRFTPTMVRNGEAIEFIAKALEGT